MWKIIIFLNFSIFCSCCQQLSPVDVAPVTNISMSIIWDECTQSFYYIDFRTTGQQKSIFRYDYNEDKSYGAYVEGHSAATFILPITDCNENKHLFAVGFGHYTVIIHWDGKSSVAKPILKPFFGVQENDPTSIMGMARQNEDGRFYSGTYHTSFCSGPANASFYMDAGKEGLKLLFTGAQTTTGIAFDKNAGMIYHTDSCSPQITAYQTDSNGYICNKRIAYDFKSSDFYPTGLESDSDGMLYTGSYTQGSIWQINPRTSIGRQIAQMPVNGVGGVAFGGPDLSTLFVVIGSSVMNPTTGQIVQHNNAPSLYKITGLGAKGRKYPRLIL